MFNVKSSVRLLFIHGWATNSGVWRYQRPFSDRFSTLFIDLPGHGGLERWYEPTFRPATDILKGILMDGIPTVCIGWSLGGEILFSLNLKEFKNIMGIVAIGSSPSYIQRKGFPFGQYPGIARMMKKKLKKDFAGTVRGFYSLNFSDKEKKEAKYSKHLDILKEAVKGLVREDMEASLDAIIENDNRDMIKDIDVPVLIVHGTDDQVCPFNVTQYIKGRIADVRLMAFNGRGHMPFLTAPEEFNSILEDFIDGL